MYVNNTLFHIRLHINTFTVNIMLRTFIKQSITILPPSFSSISSYSYSSGPTTQDFVVSNSTKSYYPNLLQADRDICEILNKVFPEYGMQAHYSASFLEDPNFLSRFIPLVFVVPIHRKAAISFLKERVPLPPSAPYIRYVSPPKIRSSS